MLPFHRSGQGDRGGRRVGCSARSNGGSLGGVIERRQRHNEFNGPCSSLACFYEARGAVHHPRKGRGGEGKRKTWNSTCSLSAQFRSGVRGGRQSPRDECHFSRSPQKGHSVLKKHSCHPGAGLCSDTSYSLSSPPTRGSGNDFPLYSMLLTRLA